MKSVHFKNCDDSKTTIIKKDKTVEPEGKKHNSNIDKIKNADEEKVYDAEWVPSRDWHKYLSDQKSDNPKPFSWEFGLPKDEFDVKTFDDLTLTKPSDKLADIKLPTVNFCNNRKVTPRNQQNFGIAELGDGDKSRIAQLVQELARYKQEKQEDVETILLLKNKVAELKSSMRKLLNRNSDSKTISKLQSQHEVEQKALKSQLSELNQLICQMQVQKATTEVQLKTIVTQAEKMTKVIHEMHRENTELQIDLRVTKERLGVAQTAVEKISIDLQNVHSQIKPMMEDKACQSVDDLGSENIRVFKSNSSVNSSDDHHLLCELFFNKSLQNDFAPKETVIILPSDSIPFFTKD